MFVTTGSAGNVSGTRSVIAFSPLACTSSASPRGSSDTHSAAGGGGGNEYADAAAAAKLARCSSAACAASACSYCVSRFGADLWFFFFFLIIYTCLQKREQQPTVYANCTARSRPRERPIWRAHTEQTGQSAIQAVRVNLYRLEGLTCFNLFTSRHR